MRICEKILIIRFSSLGDVLLASPLVRLMRSAYPSAQMDFLVRSDYSELLRYNPYLSSVIELGTKKREELKALRDQIRDTQYDVIIDIHNSLRSCYLRLFSGAKKVCVVKKGVFKRLALIKFKWNFYRKVVSVVDRYLEAVSPFDICDDGKGLEVFIPEEIISSTRIILERFNLGRFDRVIGMAPTSKHYTKRWPLERFVEMGVRCGRGNRTKILIFGGKEESEYCGDISQMINSNLHSSVTESLAGKLTLLETAAAIDKCMVVVTNDTGLMHLAAARRRKLVAIFGPTVREFGFFPYGTENIIVEKQGLSCRPCTHIGLEKCPRGHFLCMREIQVNDVLTAMHQLLSQDMREK